MLNSSEAEQFFIGDDEDVIAHGEYEDGQLDYNDVPSTFFTSSRQPQRREFNNQRYGKGEFSNYGNQYGKGEFSNQRNGNQYGKGEFSNYRVPPAPRQFGGQPREQQPRQFNGKSSEQPPRQFNGFPLPQRKGYGKGSFSPNQKGSPVNPVDASTPSNRLLNPSQTPQQPQWQQQPRWQQQPNWQQSQQQQQQGQTQQWRQDWYRQGQNQNDGGKGSLGKMARAISAIGNQVIKGKGQPQTGQQQIQNKKDAAHVTFSTANDTTPNDSSAANAVDTVGDEDISAIQELQQSLEDGEWS